MVAVAAVVVMVAVGAVASAVAVVVAETGMAAVLVVAVVEVALAATETMTAAVVGLDGAEAVVAELCEIGMVMVEVVIGLTKFMIIYKYLGSVTLSYFM